jgi:hypothetical protein
VTAIVVLAWDPSARQLDYVEINGGAGGSVIACQVSVAAAELISPELEGRLLPWMAELEIDGADVLLDASGGFHLERCSVKAKGSPANPRFVFRTKGSGQIYDVLAKDAGIIDKRSAEMVQRLEYLYAVDLAPPGCWLGCEGGVDNYLASRREQKDNAARARDADRKFVNPYTFVPFPDHLSRTAPAGHHLLGEGRLSGNFTVTWQFATPFQVPPGAEADTEGASERAALVRLPGSSVKGAIRSVHEALAGGCLRVFDDKFVPSYRDTAVVPSASWTLAVVTAATSDGQPLVVMLCDEVVWADARGLRHACGGLLQTGSRITIDDADVPEKPNGLGRRELKPDASIRPGGDWVVLVTDVGTRSVKYDKYFLACGKLGSRSAEVTEAAWTRFRVAVAGADDLNTSRRVQHDGSRGDSPPMKDVVFGTQLIGCRRVVTGRLWRDDVVWVRITQAGGKWAAEELSLAAIWRHPGWPAGSEPLRGLEQSRAGRRVPQDVLACRNPDSLCPTCRILGSADQNARDRADPAQQRAYASHVRFGDASSSEPVKLSLIRRAPMGAPRPGAGQFYLAINDPSPASGPNCRPTREWGSYPDADQPRQLRGRKFYWHADPEVQSPKRHTARAHQKDKKQAIDQWIAPPGTMLSQRVAFDNLSPAELGGLLTAFEPQRVLGSYQAGQLMLHLGGGKPLGLGSCTASVSSLRTWSASSRYGNGQESTADMEACVADFTGECTDEVRSTWPALAAVLAEDTVDPAQVWYPPGVYWSERGGNQKEFDEPFAFFAGTSGMFLTNRKPRRELRSLPVPGSGEQSLRIIRKADLD